MRYHPASAAAIGLALLAICGASRTSASPDTAAQNAQPGLPEQPGAFPYPGVAAALEALKADPDVGFSMQDGWTIATNAKAYGLWSFTPTGHPAHPSVVWRQVVQDGSRATIHTRTLCEASKAACDRLVLDFKALDERAAGQAKAQPGSR